MDASLHEGLNLGSELAKSVSEGAILAHFIVVVLRGSRFHSLRRHHVAALLGLLPGPRLAVPHLLLVACRSSRRFVTLVHLSTGLVHELQAAHLELLDRGHVDLGHVVLLVARVDVLSDRLSLRHDEVLALVDHMGHLPCTRRILKTVH